LVRSRQKATKILWRLGVPPQEVEVMEGDITLPYLGLPLRLYHKLAQQLQAIIHCAAITRFEPSPLQAFWANILGTSNLLFLARQTGDPLPFHYLSTAYVAGKKRGLIREDELDPGPGFNNLYEKSKYLAEYLLRKYRERHPFPLTIYRPTIIVGDLKTGTHWNNFGLYHFLTMVTRLHRSATIRILGNPRAIKNLVPVDHVAEVIGRILQEKRYWDRTYHITSRHPLTLEILAEAFNRALGREAVRIVSGEEWRKRPPNRQERIIARLSEPYQPYLLYEPLFDTSNTDRVLKEAGWCKPVLDRESIVFLLSQAYGGLKDYAGTKTLSQC